MPVASEMEHRGEYPHALVETMKELGLFGLNIPEEYGGNAGGLHDVRRDLRGAVARLDGAGRHHRLAPGAVPTSWCATAPKSRSGGSCRAWPRASRAAASACRSRTRARICSRSRTVARRDGDKYRVTGSKMWVTNGRYGPDLPAAGEDRPGARRPPRDERVRHRERRARADRGPRHRQARLQDGGDDGAALRRFSRACRQPDRRRTRALDSSRS